MVKYCVSRPINGISLNGNEYLLDSKLMIRTFDTIDELRDYLSLFNMSYEEMMDSFIIEEIEV
ncbi:hypothetical protein A7K50_03445 [Dehalobacter sp. MCB1]|uniref:hypothetical protein n=1 Tax=Dehalobacter sp. MCB1 TaxID=1844756 RepID=UPI000E6BE170|nr:hypothetical protein [Dehalobacter sp. MCB1]RJE47715.1 hypothetical protein A7K50_03445 [Dehalobacter sp. MCB1]